MASVKSFLPKISPILGVSPAALYERQRALVRLGVLKAKAGHGPGSGVKLSADSLAALIASLLVADNPSEIDDRVSQVLKAPTFEKMNCEITKAKTFGEALSRILSSWDGQRRLRIGLSRSSWIATIVARASLEEFLSLANDYQAVAAPEPLLMRIRGPGDNSTLFRLARHKQIPQQGVNIVALVENHIMSRLIDAFRSAVDEVQPITDQDKPE